MKRTNIIQIMPTKKQKIILKEMMMLSSCVYNMSNYIIRHQFFKQEKISSFFDIQKELQTKEDYKLLGRSYALPRIQLYSETNNSRFKLIKSKTQKKVGLPKYLKNRKTNTTIPSYLVIDNSQYKIKQNHIEIPMSRLMRKKYKIGQTFKIKYNGILKHKGKQQRGQIKYKNGKFYLHQTVEIINKTPKTNNNKIGIDLGIKRIFGLYTNNGYQKVIGSNRYYKQWKYYTEQIAQEQQTLSTTNKKTSKLLKKLYQKRRTYQNNLYNNLVAKLYRIINKNNITTIYIGDVKNIRESKSNTKTNQMINNYWSFDIMYKKIENKAEENGVQMIKITEEYTTRTCPQCECCDKSNIKDREFKCMQCGYEEDRDIVGARNILTKGMYSQKQSIHRNEIVPLEVST